MSGSEQRGVRKERTGVVTSDGMNKTIVVEVSQRYRHPLYGKVVIRKKKFHAHDEKNEAHKGDVVAIVETRPISKLKRWRLARVVRAGIVEV